MRLFRVLLGVFWFVGGVGNPLLASGRFSCEPLGEEASWPVCLRDGLDSLLQDELFLTSQVGLCVYDLTDDTYCMLIRPNSVCGRLLLKIG